MSLSDDDKRFLTELVEKQMETASKWMNVIVDNTLEQASYETLRYIEKKLQAVNANICELKELEGKQLKQNSTRPTATVTGVDKEWMSGPEIANFFELGPDERRRFNEILSAISAKEIRVRREAIFCLKVPPRTREKL